MTDNIQSVKDPSVTLYAFHLRNDITKGPQKVADNAEDLWEQCVVLGTKLKSYYNLEHLREHLLCYTKQGDKYYYNPANEDKATENDWIELIKEDPEKLGEARVLKFEAALERKGSHLTGEIYPLRIHDTYAVDLTLRYSVSIDIDHLGDFHCLPKNIQASLGQTLLLFAKPVNVPESDYRTLADKAVAKLLGDPEDQHYPFVEGKLFGSPIFEYDNSKKNPLKRRHILVWWNCHDETIQRIGQREPYHALLNLLCCRSKILYAYHQAEWCSKEAQKLYTELEQQVDKLANHSEETLKELTQHLKQIPRTAFQYAKLLRDIEDHQTMLGTNAKNYRSLLFKIRKFTVLEDNLEFLQNFLDRNCKQFQNQIQVYLSYLTPAKGLSQQMIDTIRGLVEIKAEEEAQEREKREKKLTRRLEDTIQSLAAGLGAASIVASTTGYLTQKESVPIPFSPYFIQPFYFSLVLSVVAAGVFYVGTWLITGLISPRVATSNGTENRNKK